MDVLDYEFGRLTRSRKIDKKAIDPEDVFVFRVFGTAPPASKTLPKRRLIQTKTHTAASKITELLNENDEEVEDDA